MEVMEQEVEVRERTVTNISQIGRRAGKDQHTAAALMSCSCNP